MDSKIKDIILRVIGWGLGGVLLIAGALVMAFHKFLNIAFPEYLFIGAICMIFGFMIWLIPMCFDFVIKKQNLKYDNEIKLEEQKAEIGVKTLRRMNKEKE